MTLGRSKAIKHAKLGSRVVISDGSGIDSLKTGVLVPWSEARELASEYPFVGGRTPGSMGWSAIRLDNGELATVPNNRITLLAEVQS